MIESIEANENEAILVFTDVVTTQDLLEARKAVIYTPEFRLRKFHIWYFHDVTDVEFDTEQMKTIRTEDYVNAMVNPNLKVALVGNTDVGFGMFRMYQGYAGRLWNMEVFRDYDAALAWARA